jgi:hypothetical protein
LKITYANTKAWRGTTEISYVYTPILMAGSSYKYYEAVYGDYRQSRTLLNKHGIYIEVGVGFKLQTTRHFYHIASLLLLCCFCYYSAASYSSLSLTCVTAYTQQTGLCTQTKNKIKCSHK